MNKKIKEIKAFMVINEKLNDIYTIELNKQTAKNRLEYIIIVKNLNGYKVKKCKIKYEGLK